MITVGLQRTNGKRARRKQSNTERVFSLFRHVADFMAQNNGANFKAFITQEVNDSLGLIVMTDGEAYDFDLATKLYEGVGPFVGCGLLSRVMLLPASTPDELTAFLDVESALCLIPQNTGPST
jgi:hypothetical protein